jgi:predicted nucleic acid-binding protein
VTNGLVDTSVIVDWDDPSVIAGLPDDVAVSTITMAELAAGPHIASDPAERARPHPVTLVQHG